MPKQLTASSTSRGLPSKCSDHSNRLKHSNNTERNTSRKLSVGLHMLDDDDDDDNGERKEETGRKEYW